MEIGMLPLPAKLKGKLISAGYTTRSCISAVSPANLARELKVSESDALEIIGHAAAGVPHGDPFISGSRTAWDMFNEEALLQRITTSSADLDYMLDGGISRGQVTEIGGVPGIGKTQMGIQLAVNVQIPVDCGGLGGKAIYIDTEGSFMLERALQIAEACIDDLEGNYTKASQSRLHPKAFLENIFYFRICCSIEQIALINYLDKFISEQRDIQIVIIDSVTFHFRHDFDDLGLRTRILGEMALKLMKLAHKFCLAVVLLNQVTTKYTEGSLQMTLALGDSWSHACTNRIILHWNGDERYAYIAKSLALQSAAAPYVISGRGIRDANPGDERIKGRCTSHDPRE